MSKGWRCNFNDCEKIVSAHVSCTLVGLKDCIPPIQHAHNTAHFSTRAPGAAQPAAARQSPRRACRIKTRTRETPRRARGAAPRGACPWDLRTGDRNCEPNRGLISHTTPMTRREHERSEMSFVTGVGDDKTRAQLGFRTSRSDRARRIATVHRSGATGAHACATAARHLQHWSMSLEEVPQL